MSAVKIEKKEVYDSFAFPGGYAIRYIVGEGEIVCASCVNHWHNTEGADFIPPVGSTLYWEGPDVNCAECNKVMHSEYGDPENPDAPCNA